MREKLKSKFLPTHYIHDNYLKLHKLKQGSKSVEEYTREFEQLLMKCDLKEEETQTLVRYLSGLDESIAHVVELHPYSSLDELSSLAYKVEQHQKSKGKGIASKPPTQPPTPPPSFQVQGPPNTFPKIQTPLPPRSTPQNTQPPPQRTLPKPDERRRCFRCQGLGHIASECPNKRVVTLAEYQASLEEHGSGNNGDQEMGTDEVLEEVVEGPDEGELLVIQRALSGLAPHGEGEQRESIFRTRCTIGGKVCSLIVDGGSCTNVASQLMVDKLNLVATPHPNPYNIQWLSQGKGLQISSKCLVTLSIGKSYQDQVWCDIVPMKACHILLGRPWLFDRAVMHDGHKNTYTFNHGHKRVTLTPLQKSAPSQSKESLTTLHHHASPHVFHYNVPPDPPPQKPLPSLRSNSHQPGEYDGDHRASSWDTLPKIQTHAHDTRKAKKGQALAGNQLLIAWEKPPGSSRA